MQDLMDTWPVDNASVAVVAEGFSWAGDPGRVYDWASVTKLVSALAVHIAAEEEELDLDESWGPAGSTVRHLLAHASGLPFEGDAPVAAPGARRVYSNAGYDALGVLLENRMGVPAQQILSHTVLGPLGMTHAVLDGRAGTGMRGTVRDLALLAAELLEPTLLSREAHAVMTALAYPGLDGVLPGFGAQRPNDWSLGPELRAGKSPHWTSPANDPTTFGHFGQAGGFLWVDPVAQIACACLTDEPFGAWATQLWPQLSTRVLGDAGITPGDLAG